jgi:hypothetical protein
MSVLLDENSSLNGPGPTADMTSTGQNGFMRNSVSWKNSSRFVQQRMIAVLVEAPVAATRYLTDAPDFVATLKSLIEDRPSNISGINFNINWEFNETIEGNAGEVRETVTNATRDRNTPSITWPETIGRAISNFWEFTGRNLLMDPETGRPLLAANENYVNDPNRIPLTEDNVSFTVLFFEPNSTLDGVVRAALVRNMQPKSVGDVQLTRNVGEALEAPTVEVEFTGITERNDMVNQMAQDYLDDLNKLGLDPDSLPTYIEEISPDVIAADNGAANALEG